MPRAVPLMCCVVLVFAMFIGEGNGKWKSNNREKLKEDIEKLQEMAEKIEDEIEDVYDEYSEEWPNDEYLTKEDNEKDSAMFQNKENNEEKLNFIDFVGNSSTNVIEDNPTTVHEESAFSENPTPKIHTMKEVSSPEKINVVNSKWPKFEDILLEIGRKYDWKNDRWIKVKKKANQSSEENHLTFHERHKFSYKTVKLSRSKSRRNVVIAVTAVR